VTWICGRDGCNAVRAGLTETIVSCEEMKWRADRIAQLEAALLRVQHGLEDRDWAETRSEMIDFIINTVHESRSQSETPADAVDRISDEAMELAKGYGWKSGETEAEYCRKCGARTDDYPIGAYHKCS